MVSLANDVTVNAASSKLSAFRFVSPIVGAALIIWWIVSTVKDDPRWYYLENESLIFTLYEVHTSTDDVQ